MRIFANANYNFIKWRWHALIVSLVDHLGRRRDDLPRGGLPLGIDFTGGTGRDRSSTSPPARTRSARALGPISKDAVVQRFGRRRAEPDSWSGCREPPARGQGDNLDDDAKRVEQALRAANIGVVPGPAGKDIVGPVIGKDCRARASGRRVAALGGILVYVGFRFRFTFAVGAIVATFHDILITLVFLTWFGYDLSLNVIAAHPDDRRLLGERHDRRVRPRAREPAHRCGASRSIRSSTRSVNQTLGPHDHHLGRDVPGGASRCTCSAAKCCAASRSRCSSASSPARTRPCSSPRRSPSS